MAGVPRAREGQIKVQWANTAEGGEDLHYFRGEGVGRADGWLLHSAISAPTHSPMKNEWHPSLLEELEARGYDIKTLKISVEKKKPEA